jgi:hypothetical protein
MNRAPPPGLSSNTALSKPLRRSAGRAPPLHAALLIQTDQLRALPQPSTSFRKRNNQAPTPNRAPPLLLAALLLSLAPHSAHAQGVNPTIGGGGACTGGLLSDGTTQGTQIALNDGLYTCVSSAWVPETLTVGSVLQSGAAPTCSAATAGMLEYTAGTIEYCNGTSFTTFSAGGLNNVDIELAAGTAAAPSLSFFADTATGLYQASSASHTLNFASNGAEVAAFDSTGDFNLTNAGATGVGAYQINGTAVLALPDKDTTSIAVGASALAAQSATGSDNTALGISAAQYISTGTHNVAIGWQTMQGVSATPQTSGGGYNVAVGDQALYQIQGAAARNTAIGQAALTAATTDTNSTAVGYEALFSQAAGSPNSALGYLAGEYITTGTHNTAIGTNAMLGVAATPMTGTGNTAVGDAALTALQGAGTNNTAVGHQAGQGITSGSTNIAIGNAALLQTTTGSNNIALGTNTLSSLTTGSNNTAIGYSALLSDTTGINSALGYLAGKYISTGTANTAIGTNAMLGVSATPVTQNNNTAVGDGALTAIQGAATDNTAIGQGALNVLTTGSNTPSLARARCRLSRPMPTTPQSAFMPLRMRIREAPTIPLSAPGRAGVLGAAALAAARTPPSAPTRCRVATPPLIP